MLRYLWLSVFVLLLDQVSKYMVIAYIKVGQAISVLPFLEVTYTHNSGVAFGMGKDGAKWVTWGFIAISTLVSAMIINWIRGLTKQEKLLAIGLSLILGGAIGNVLDRFIHTSDGKRGVVDFIHVIVGSGDWFPWVFNIADTAISIGVGLVIIFELFRKKPVSEKSA